MNVLRTNKETNKLNVYSYSILYYPNKYNKNTLKIVEKILNKFLIFFKKFEFKKKSQI